MKLSEKLKSLNITLPTIALSFGAYIPVKRTGNLVYVSGQLPMKDGKLIATGPIPSKCSIEDAKAAAKLCVINGLAAVNAMVPGGVDAIVQVVRVGVFVCSDNDFIQQPEVGNGASEFLVELLGDPGKHARAAIGNNVLPRGASVEVEFIFDVK